MNKRRIGKVRIPYKLYVESDEEHTLLDQMYVFLHIFPVRAEMMIDSQNIEIIGISHNFDEIPEGEVVPEYQIEIYGVGDDSYKFHVVRK